MQRKQARAANNCQNFYFLADTFCFSAFTSLLPSFLCSLMLLTVYFTLLLFVWFNWIWCIRLLLFLKDLLFLSSQPSPFHSHPILLSRLLCLTLLFLLGLQPLTRLSSLHYLLLVLSPLCCPSFTSSIISSIIFHSTPVFSIPFFVWLFSIFSMVGLCQG